MFVLRNLNINTCYVTLPDKFLILLSITLKQRALNLFCLPYKKIQVKCMYGEELLENSADTENFRPG